ncbi:matrixin family metalloprotease [Arthrobacter burdickii]|uniref:Matrixin family metalloprotease n=1 Tax=Arthrobacter burdickii TaxID=3035920 RepID=A0ABT8K4A6_9MICC|nr:matrixin family metalloprotease [Arthrobacter burdickii]MDN4612278.1 matrixin family metalloprotease [Arthrobacter burdickii]
MGAMDREWFHEGRDARMNGVRRSPSGRIPEWSLDDALRQASAPPPWRPGPAQKKRRRARMKLRLGTVGALALLVFLYLTPTLFDRYVLPAALPYLPGAEVPPRGVEAGDVPLGVPPPAPASNAYKLMESPVEDQEWVAYDPCRPVHYVVRPDNAPAGSEGLVQEAVAEVSAATGLQFVDDGTTMEAPTEDRDLYQPELYGKRWVPVLITWTDPTEIPGLEGDVAGLGGSDYAQTLGHPLVYVGGQVQLDAPDAAETLQYPDGRAYLKATIMHELGHVVGLDHVDDPHELMYADNIGQISFGDGDRAGLALLGTGPCVPGL